MRKRRGLGWAVTLLAMAVGVEAAAQDEASEQAPVPDASATVEAERARAHERMPSTMYASTPSADKPYFAHPSTSATLEAERAEPSDWHRATAKRWGPTSAESGDTAEDVFRNSISEPVVQSKCIVCHVSGGASGATRLVFAPATTNDHVSFNYRVFEDFFVSVPNGAALILDKIKGVAHGGGTQVPAGSNLYADMERFLDLLDGGDAAPVTAETLFDTVRMRSNRETLYRAAIILAGRIPTEAEYAALEGGLLAPVRGLMTGPGFHDFLIRAANDRLLTEGVEPSLHWKYRNYRDEMYRLRTAVDDGIEGAQLVYTHFSVGVDFGVRRAPLELIAHVVENDLPYTNILTANYVMANPQTAIAYGATRANEEFGDADDVHEFRPARIGGYYPYSSVECEDSRCTVVGPAFDLPHAGILSTQSLLYRYPTTSTNRNRARARWTYYHFLGIDVERLGPRVLDPSSLVDEENPTMHNPACTSCHGILDPVAGTFQYYDGFGTYKASDHHSLPGSYLLPRTYATMGRKALTLEPRTISFRGSLPDHGQAYLFLYPDGDGLMYVGKLAMLNNSGRYVISDFGPGSIRYPSDKLGCRALEDHVVVERGCEVYFSLPLPLQAGEYRFEVTAWRSGEMSLRPELTHRLYRNGDTWFRDMRKPGFNGAIAPETTDSLEWLGQKIAEDRRFAEATVKFWWPAVMGREVARPPTDRSDPDFESRLLEAEAQRAEVERLARMFRDGARGGKPYNLKDVLAELFLSRWFRAKSITDANQVRRAALRSAGGARPLTPEELVNKTEALTGYVWGRQRRSYGPERDRPLGYVQRDYAPLYGGIDSQDVTERSRQFTGPAAQVAKLHANGIATLVAVREFLLLPARERRLFSGIELSDTPEAASDDIKAKLAELQEVFYGVPAGADDVRDAYRFFGKARRYWKTASLRLTTNGESARLNDYYLWKCMVLHRGISTDGCYLEGIRDDARKEWGSVFNWNQEVVEELGDGIEVTEAEMRMVMTWSTVLAAMLMDYRYLHL